MGGVSKRTGISGRKCLILGGKVPMSVRELCFREKLSSLGRKDHVFARKLVFLGGNFMFLLENVTFATVM